MNDDPTELDLVYEDLRKAQQRMEKLGNNVRELSNLVMVLSELCKDEALKARAERLVKRVWESMI